MAKSAVSSPEWYLKVKDASSDLGRLTIFHYGFKEAAQGRLLFVPLDFSAEPRNVLDVGTADGLWMREVLSSIPEPPSGSHQFTGTDLHPSFFPSSGPANIKYVKHDINAPPPPAWHDSFDLINMRMILIAAGSAAAQRAVVTNHIKLLKPGGWIQLGDCDRVCPTPITENPRYHDMFACIRAVVQASGAAPLEAPNMKQWLVEAGLIDVQEITAMRPVGKKNSNEELGHQSIQADLIIAQGMANAAKSKQYTLFLQIPTKDEGLDFNVRPLPVERLDTLATDVKKELEDKGAFFPMRFIWGRKSSQSS